MSLRELGLLGGSRGRNDEPFVSFQIETAPSWISVASWMMTPTPNNVVLTSANHAIIHSHQSSRMMTPTGNSGDADTEPEFGFLQLTWRLLLLSTALACCSAFDANHQCRSIQANNYYEELTDDAESNEGESESVAQRWEEQLLCKQMFYYVVVPVGITILVGVILCSWILRRHLTHISPDARVDRLTRHARHYAACLQLAAVIFLMLLAWTYGTIAIMLRPRFESGDDDDTSNNDNPYQSLAAVDSMGHVSDNANLYYTCWISLGLVMALMYQIVGDAVRQYRHRRRERLRGAVHVGDVEAMLSSMTVYQLENYRESRAMWYQSLYRLRIRTGIWTATCLATLLVMASSVHIWREVLYPSATKLVGGGVKFRDVCSILVDSASLPSTLCARTSFSLFSGMSAAVLSFGAIVTHLLARRGAAQVVDKGNTEQHACAQSFAFPNEARSSFDHGGGTSFPLRSEFILAVTLSNLLGINAVFATGVQGPAAAVGNLYYASWISFLLCLRICLGCLEELCDIDEEQLDQSPTNESRNASSPTSGYDPPSVAGSDSTPNSRYSTDDIFSNSTDLNYNERAQRTRRYLSLGIFSTVCSASAFDAAMNQQDELDAEQQFVILAPSLVAIVCACQFLLCLRTKTYRIVSQIWLGGLLSVLVCSVCLITLIITMHSESSWAVNAIGEIQMANLYYFTWASIITAGVQMASYIVSYMGVKNKPYLTVAWGVVYKVCFAMLGAGFHIWHNIWGACTFDEITSGAVTFCSRTILAIAIAITGLLVSGLVTIFRIMFAAFWADSMARTRAHVEMVLSVFLVLLFGAAVALITGIGGPGQSVGDLFYGTWLAFLVSIGLVGACLEEVRRVEAEAERSSSPTHQEVADGVLT